MITLLIVSTVATAATPGTTQPVSKKMLPLQMAQSASIEGSWRLANMTEADLPTPMLPSTDLTADFTGDRVTGSGGCNRFNGGYKTQGEQLSIGPLASTFKACEESIMTQEARFLKALQAAQRYEVNDQGLQIFYTTDQGSGVLRFTSQAVQGLW
ncbi:META domain-containing protein (plasmid) [Kovacikia minuta CCNUW1]|uniref:META domain-containing protein n=1 Tax=Kovacikia minuta TaxID=2931930 RepID=UPI001CD0171F|nr:META domain-containing protein [Kovacikia minuta]UBF30306.1 META domain-containing protein [Kovacikia minuta CCNUW1]